VLNAEAAIVEMIERLVGPLPVEVRGMALLERILTNADCGSPLYNLSQPGTLHGTIRSAIAALDAQPSHSHEFALTV
jgi:hypothetical protein